MSGTFQDEVAGKPAKRSRGFPAGTLILTGRGYTPVEDVAIGDMALDGDMRWRKVKGTFENKGATRLLKGHGHPGLHVGEGTALHLRLRRCFKNARKGEPVDRDFSKPSWVTPDQAGDAHYWATPTRFQGFAIPPIRRMENQYVIEPDEDTLWLSGYLVGSGTPHGRTDRDMSRIAASADQRRLQAFMDRIGR